MDSRRKKRLRERVGLKIFTAVVAVVCVFACFASFVLTAICIKNNVYFEEDHATLTANITDDIAGLEAWRFRYRLQESMLMYTDNGTALDPEQIEPYIEKYLPKNCNFIFLLTDEKNRNIYCTADYSGTGDISGYTKSDYGYDLTLSVLTDRYEQVSLDFDTLSSADNELDYLVYNYQFRGTLYGVIRSGELREAVPIFVIGENGKREETAYTAMFYSFYNYYTGTEFDFPYDGEISDTDDLPPAVTTVPLDDDAILYLSGEMLAAETITAHVNVYIADDPQVVDSIYYGKLMAGLIAENPRSYPIIFICAAVIFLVCIIYLCCAAGYRYPSDKPVPMWFDKIPFEMFLAAAGLAVYFAIMSYIYLVYDLEYLTIYDVRLLWIGLVIAIIIAISTFVVLTIMTLATRLKTSSFWKYTVVGFIVGLIAKVLKLIWTAIVNIRLTWKVVVLMAAFFLWNIFGLIIAVDTYTFEAFIIMLLASVLLLTTILIIWALGFTRIRDYSKKVADGELGAAINKDILFGDLKRTAIDLEGVGEGVRKAVDERMRSERLKTELITNVSHDLKTPLTSIVNYVDILSKDEIESETAKEHIDILKRQAAKMKKLIEDLVEVSKATSRNVAVSLERTDVNLLVTQTETEYAAKFSECKLEPVIKIPEQKMIANLDGRLMWRVLDNLCSNICKYAMPHTRVYISVENCEQLIKVSFKNISRFPLDISGEDLTERFVRGDSSRNTEGSGLGLSIAKSLCDLQGVGFGITIDGDLFKVELTIHKLGDWALLYDTPEQPEYETMPEIRAAYAKTQEETVCQDDKIEEAESPSVAEEVPPEGDDSECQKNSDTD